VAFPGRDRFQRHHAEGICSQATFAHLSSHLRSRAVSPSRPFSAVRANKSAFGSSSWSSLPSALVTLYR
jgi:hypothetical protein